VERRASGEHYNQNIRMRTVKHVKINGERMRTKANTVKTTFASMKTQPTERTMMLLFSPPVLQLLCVVIGYAMQSKLLTKLFEMFCCSGGVENDHLFQKAWYMSVCQKSLSRYIILYGNNQQIVLLVGITNLLFLLFTFVIHLVSELKR